MFSLANNNSANKSETPEPPSDKSTCASITAAEVAKIQDYTSPEAIPEGTSAIRCVEGIHSSDNSAMCRYNITSYVTVISICVCVSRNAVRVVEGLQHGGTTTSGPGPP